MRLLAVLMPLLILGLFAIVGVYFYKKHNQIKELKAAERDRDILAGCLNEIRDVAEPIDAGESNVADALALASGVIGRYCTVERLLEQPEALLGSKNRRMNFDRSKELTR